MELISTAQSVFLLILQSSCSVLFRKNIKTLMHQITSFDVPRSMPKDMLKNYSCFEDNLLCAREVGGREVCPGNKGLYFVFVVAQTDPP